jgi:hypothetical protein
VSDLPLVSVGMPAYNGGPFVRDALESLLGQEDVDLELIVSDDGSTDGTAEVCAELAGRDPRLRLVQGPHRGERANFNAVLWLARGRYFMWAADHDRWDRRYVATCLAALEHDRAAVLAYGRTTLIDADGATVGEVDDALGITGRRAIDRYRALIWRLEAGNPIYGVMRTELLKATGGYGDHPAPDHLVLAKMALRGTFAQVPAATYFRRQNRPPETAEESRRRQPTDLDPGRAATWLARPAGEYFRPLRDAHIAAVLRAPIPVGHRILGVTTTVACFRERFGVRSRTWSVAHKVIDRLPAAVRGRAVGVFEGGR